MTENTPIRIATRSSRLALWQAEHVAHLLRKAAPEVPVEIIHVSTLGDRDLTEPLRNMGTWGIFTREVQRVVLDGAADLAVHSLKDLPTEIVPGLVLGAVPTRGAWQDALVLPSGSLGISTLLELPLGARLGTGSLRRQAQLRHLRPDLQLVEIRGNVETRLRKLDSGEYDGLILAVAGLTRLEHAARISQTLAPPQMYPAVGQGALGLECRSDDHRLRDILGRISDPQTMAAVTAERSLLAALRAGCHAPLGVFTSQTEAALRLTGVVLSQDGQTKLEATAESPLFGAEELGVQVADLLRAQGAESLIAASRST